MDIRATTNATEILYQLTEAMLKLEAEARESLSPRHAKNAEDQALLTLQLVQCQIILNTIRNTAKPPLSQLMDIIILASQMLCDEKTKLPESLKETYNKLLILLDSRTINILNSLNNEKKSSTATMDKIVKPQTPFFEAKLAVDKLDLIHDQVDQWADLLSESLIRILNKKESIDLQLLKETKASDEPLNRKKI